VAAAAYPERKSGRFGGQIGGGRRLFLLLVERERASVQLDSLSTTYSLVDCVCVCVMMSGHGDENLDSHFARAARTDE
jgi:hypothetical protein